MRFLISASTLPDAQTALRAGVDILDLKSPQEGSLGAPPPSLIHEASRLPELKPLGIALSAALGDLHFQPSTAALAAYGAVHAGADYVKAGLRWITTSSQATQVMAAVAAAAREASPTVRVAAAGFADYRQFGGLPPQAIVDAAEAAKADIAMLDTAIKDGRGLLDCLTAAELQRFLESARQAGLQVALAGALRGEHLPVLAAWGVDIVGLRGAVCRELDRTAPLCPARLDTLLAERKRLAPAGTVAGPWGSRLGERS